MVQSFSPATDPMREEMKHTDGRAKNFLIYFIRNLMEMEVTNRRCHLAQLLIRNTTKVLLASIKILMKFFLLVAEPITLQMITAKFFAAR